MTGEATSKTTKKTSKKASKARRRRTPKRAAASSAARSRAKASRKPAAALRKRKGCKTSRPIHRERRRGIDKWYCNVMGFSVAERWEKERHVPRGSSERPGRGPHRPGRLETRRDRQKGQGVRVYITTADDVDAYAKAITSRGGTLDHEPKDDWGFRAFSVTDPDGYKLTIMRPLK